MRRGTRGPRRSPWCSWRPGPARVTAARQGVCMPPPVTACRGPLETGSCGLLCSLQRADAINGRGLEQDSKGQHGMGGIAPHPAAVAGCAHARLTEADMTQARTGGGPAGLGMILARQLQALREKAGLTHEQAAEAIYASPWTVRRMERAEGGLKPLAVKGLLLAYGITDVREIDAFLSLAREASTPGWWHSYSDVLPSWFRVFPGLEQAAELIRGYEPHCVPGLLQTEDYARATVLAGYPDAPAEETGRRVALRISRQLLLTRPGPPRLWVVMDEAVLRRPVGGPGVMRAQLDRLIEATGLPNITLQALPFAVGPHPAMYGTFHVFRFPAQELPDIVCGENMTSAFYLDKPQDAATYVHALDRICALPAPPQLTSQLPTHTPTNICPA